MIVEQLVLKMRKRIVTPAGTFVSLVLRAMFVGDQ